ncbi:hypothetical protein V0U79_04585 [Hyphobacterium sp. HN65]|uniref:Uncharacterized protein n=1 Tax=Hyphobacterium lacteum TaxID=3116575 RepID=A0ABU7LNZ6_9PROT|nr:hypothetical protein [Hyphobacterium sp. HN65]MEE2525633.1 hypothetical protein [Hyphobacterium sp. HN65]
MIGFILAALLVQDAEAAETVPPLVTIAEIHADPWAWDGRRVRVVARVDECSDLNCLVCDETDSGEPWPEPRIPSDPRRNMCAGVTFIGGELADRMVRFSTVRIEADYSATCSRVMQPGTDSFVICSDRATELYNASVLSIAQVWPPSYYESDQPQTVFEADGEMRANLEAAYANVAWGWWREGSPAEVFFWVNRARLASERTVSAGGAGACECNYSSCPDENWPRRIAHTYAGENNSYTCYFAVQREDGSWVFPLQ